MKWENHIQGTVSPLFLIVVIVISGLSLIFTIWRSATTYQPRESVLALHQYPADEKNISHVKVGLFIDSFRTFDIIKNEFTFDGSIWFEFNPQQVAPEIIDQFTFLRGEMIERSSAVKQTMDPAKMVMHYSLVVKLTSDLNYTFFPLDDHIISLILINRAQTAQPIVFDVHEKSFAVKHDLSNSGWVRRSQAIQVGYIASEVGTGDTLTAVKIPAAVFSIGYGRTGARHLVTILFPLIILFFITLFSLCLEPKKYLSTILSLCLAAITGLIAYRFVIDNMSPKVNYFLMSDYLWLLFFAAIFCVFFTNTIAFSLSERTKKILVVLLNVLLVACCSYFLLFWQAWR